MKKIALFWLLALGVGCGISASQAQVVSYNLNFTGRNTDAAPVNFTNLVVATFFTPEAESWSLGNGLTLAFASVNNYDFSTTTQPLTDGGLFVAGGTTSAFTLSGLAVGSTVTLYAIDAWDQGGSAATITFGGQTVSTAGSNDNGWNGSPAAPGTTPSVSDFTLIASSVVVGGTGTLSGLLSGANGGAGEGQLGGFIIQITPAAVPEPSTWAMLGAGGALLLALGARRHRC